MTKNKTIVQPAIASLIPNPMTRYHFEDEHHAIQHFFSFIELEEAQELLYEFFRCWVVSDNVTKLNSSGRDHVVLFYEQLCILLEASLRLQLDLISKGAKLHCHIAAPKSPIQ